MTQKIRDRQLEKRSNRLKIPLRTRTYKILGTGVALCYRRTSEQFGTWSVRIALADGRYNLKTLGNADDYDDANGQTILTFEQAQEAALARFKALQQDGGIIKSPYTVAEAVDAYLEWFRVHRKSIVETEAMIRAHILPTFGEDVIDTLKSERIKAWLTRLASKPARKRSKLGAATAHREAPKDDDEKRSRKSTANRILTVFKAILNKAYEDDKVSTCDAWKKVKPFKSVDEPVVRFLQPQEATRLLNTSEPDFRKLVNAALMTGARYSELTAMTVADFSQEGASIFVRPSKSGKGRHIPLTAEGVQVFADATLGKTGRELIFTRANGSTWGKNYQVRPLLAACTIAKIEPAIGFHELRHTYASLLAQAGADLLTISKLLGHADTRITSRHYAHLCDKTLASAVNRFLPNFGTPPAGNVKALKTKSII
jgi:integrase